jgi:hypothetical protein
MLFLCCAKSDEIFIYFYILFILYISIAHKHLEEKSALTGLLHGMPLDRLLRVPLLGCKEPEGKHTNPRRTSLHCVRK